ncbi:MFS transporter [Streptomyces sp. cmx-4-9]|uniref:MFS transporter n=1 Tax=Streptomyces sp. cmx-4-9 TaxID=2790941 RepID=UPI00397FBF69
MYVSASRASDAARGLPRAAAGPAVAGNVLVLGLVSLVTDVSAEMVTAVLPLYLVVGLGMSPLAFGALDGLYQGATALLRLAGGHVADRTARHKLVAGTGYALSAVCKLGLLAVSAPWAIGAVLAADRAGKGLRTAPRDALISLSAPPEGQGRAFGVHRAMDTAGALLGPLVAFGVLWAAHDAYETVFTVSFCTAAFAVLLLALFVRDVRGKPARPVPPSRRGPGPAAVLRDPGVRRLAPAAALLGVFTVGDSFVYLLLQRRLELPAAVFPLLPVATAAGFLLLAVPLGRLADRAGRGPVFLAGHAALAAAYLLLLSPLGGAAAAVLVLVLLGAFYAATDGVLMAAAGPLLPAPLRASGMAVVQTAQALARLAGALLFGAGWTYAGPGAALACAAGGLVLAIAVLRASGILEKEALR